VVKSIESTSTTNLYKLGGKRKENKSKPLNEEKGASQTQDNVVGVSKENERKNDFPCKFLGKTISHISAYL